SRTPRPLPSTPQLLEKTVRFLTPESRMARISVSGMPHRPKPPAMIVIPSLSNPANAERAAAWTLFMTAPSLPGSCQLGITGQTERSTRRGVGRDDRKRDRRMRIVVPHHENRSEQNSGKDRADEEVSERNEIPQQSGDESEHRHQCNENPIHCRYVDRHCPLLVDAPDSQAEASESNDHPCAASPSLHRRARARRGRPDVSTRRHGRHRESFGNTDSI